MRAVLFGLTFVSSFFATAETKRDERDERGASFTEYVVLLALVVAIVIAAWSLGLGEVLKTKLNNVGGSVSSAGN